jgi:hypothetical protein
VLFVTLGACLLLLVMGLLRGWEAGAQGIAALDIGVRTLGLTALIGLGLTVLAFVPLLSFPLLLVALVLLLTVPSLAAFVLHWDGGPVTC